MALFPTTTETKFKLQPGANGEKFVADLPGYHDGAIRINRSNNRLNVTPHEALSQKYMFDRRLRPEFKYGFAAGYNNMVITKGHIVAADPYMDMADWTSDKQFNVLTLANGGATVKIREDSDTYGDSTVISADAKNTKAHGVGLYWAPVEGLATTYSTGFYRACQKGGNAQLKTAKMAIDSKTGKVLKDATFATDGSVVSGTSTDDVRPANVPLGMLERNEYTKFNNDSFDGMQPGPIITDAIVELPYFAFKDKAEENPWGSIYGNLKVGDLVKSDENGRLTVSPLSAEDLVDSMTAGEIERERQQVVGQVIGFNHDMVPEGGYKWAQWALEDRLRYEGFAPDMYTENNRPGEDNIAASAYQSTGRYPGYPYDSAYTEHDLQMLGSGTRLGNFDKFMQEEYILDHGIPGLTDGANAVSRSFENRNAAVIRSRGDNTEQPYVKQFVRVCPNGNFVDGSLEVQLTAGDGKEAYVAVSSADDVAHTPKKLTDAFAITYYNAVQGLIVIEVVDEAKADAALKTGSLTVNLKYKKKGLAGVPTFMDWDGCVGSAKIMLQR